MKTESTSRIREGLKHRSLTVSRGDFCIVGTQEKKDTGDKYSSIVSYVVLIGHHVLTSGTLSCLAFTEKPVDKNELDKIMITAIEDFNDKNL